MLTTAATEKILDQVYRKACRLICNQALYQLAPLDAEPGSDRLYQWRDDVDTLSPSDIELLVDLIEKSPLCWYDRVMIEVASQLPLTYLYDKDGWVDTIADYIHRHSGECEDLIRAKGVAIRRR